MAHGDGVIIVALYWFVLIVLGLFLVGAIWLWFTLSTWLNSVGVGW